MFDIDLSLSHLILCTLLYRFKPPPHTTICLYKHPLHLHLFHKQGTWIGLSCSDSGHLLFISPETWAAPMGRLPPYSLNPCSIPCWNIGTTPPARPKGSTLIAPSSMPQMLIRRSATPATWPLGRERLPHFWDRHHMRPLVKISMLWVLTLQ